MRWYIVCKGLLQTKHFFYLKVSLQQHLPCDVLPLGHPFIL